LARCLIIACGCRGRSLTRELRSRGHAVRGTTRSAQSAPVIDAAGAEAVIADPDRVGSLVPALDRVTVACVLLGSAVGSPAHLTALHGTRLEMLLTRIVDTTVRAVVYEASGSVDGALLAKGAALVRDHCEDSRIPYVLLRADPADHDGWLAAAAAAVQSSLDGETIGRR
jgi:uncharacterized protein YbjT (DUF2867 family)